MEKKNQIPKYPLLRFPEFTDEWKEVKLGEVLSFEVGYPFSSDAFNEEGNGVRLIKNRDLKADDRVVFYGGEYDAQYIVQNGDILIGMDGDFSPCLWKKGKALLNQRVGRVNANQNTSRVFILYVLVDSLKKIEHKTSSTTVKHLSHKDVEKIKASLPSLAEQKKIAALLSLIDERIEVQNAIIKEQEALKASLIRRLFDRTLRFPEFTDEWKEVKLGEVGEYVRGLTYNADDVQDMGTIVIRANNLNDGCPIDFKTELVHVSILPDPHQILRNTDITICMANGSSHLVGKASYCCDTSLGTITVGAFCGIFRSTNDLARWIFQTPTYKRYIYKAIQGGNGAIANLKSDDILNQSYFLPSLAEQRKIAALLSAVDERIAVEKEYATLLQKQKAYLLRQMFV